MYFNPFHTKIVSNLILETSLTAFLSDRHQLRMAASLAQNLMEKEAKTLIH